MTHLYPHHADGFVFVTGNLLDTVSADMCEQIANLRRQVQQLSKKDVLVLDETAIKLSEAPRCTLVLPGNKQYVVIESTSKYAPRYDMIACIHFNGALTPMIVSPQMRKQAKSHGITLEMLIRYITDTLADEVGHLPIRHRSLIYDKAPIHSDKKVMAAFQTSGVPLEHLVKLPTASSKRASPLDNSLFHEWKDRVRDHVPLTLENIEQVMIDTWRETKIESIRNYYHNCGFMRGQDPHFDCPDPTEHEH